MPELNLTSVELEEEKANYNSYNEHRMLLNIYAKQGRDTLHIDNAETIKGVIPKHEFSNVLDVGCGGGTSTSIIDITGDNITLIDFSEHLLSMAKSKLKYNFTNIVDHHVDLMNNQDIIRSNAPYNFIMLSGSLPHIVDISIVETIIDLSIQSLVDGGLLYWSGLRVTREHISKEGFFKSSKYGYKIYFKRYLRDEVLSQHKELRCIYIDDTVTKQDILYLGRKV